MTLNIWLPLNGQTNTFMKIAAGLQVKRWREAGGWGRGTPQEGLWGSCLLGVGCAVSPWAQTSSCYLLQVISWEEAALGKLWVCLCSWQNYFTSGTNPFI